MHKQAVRFIRKSCQSSNDYLSFGYLTVLHSVLPMPEVESLICDDDKIDIAHIKRLRGDGYSVWKGEVIGHSNFTQHKIRTEDSRPI